MDLNWAELATTYCVYYFAQLLVNATFLSFYAVMAFTEHPPCRTNEFYAPNGTTIFIVFFLVGFGLHLVCFIMATFVEPLMR